MGSNDWFPASVPVTNPPPATPVTSHFSKLEVLENQFYVVESKFVGDELANDKIKVPIFLLLRWPQLKAINNGFDPF